MTFEMDTELFARWSVWVNANAYKWFVLNFSEYHDEPVPHKIRFITPFEYSYTAYDRIIVSVVSELFAERDNVVGPPFPPPISPPTNSNPACQPYSCSAYEDFLSSQANSYTISYTTSPSVPLSYPFSDGTADGKFRYYGNFISAPVVITGYGSDPYISTGEYANANFPKFCSDSGIPQHLLCIDGVGTVGYPNALLPAIGDDRWGDNEAELLITGLNGTSAINGTLMSGTGKNWLCTFGSASNFTVTNVATASISASTSGNDVTITLFVGAGAGGEGYENTTTAFTVLNVGDTLQPIHLSISGGQPYGQQLPTRPQGWTGLVMDITVSCSYAGQSATITGTQYLGYGEQYVPVNTSAVQTANTLYTYPRLFYDAACSVASIQWGTETIDTTASGIAWERNFTDYEIPAWCNQ